jgi:hypothetical protein
MQNHRVVHYIFYKTILVTTLHASTGAGKHIDCRNNLGNFENAYYAHISTYDWIAMTTYTNKKIKIENSRAERKKNKLEASKLIFDLMKHMTTVSSGSILLVVTFIEKILHGTKPSVFMGISFGGFCLSILTALIAMFVLAVKFDEKFTDGEANFFAISAVLSMGAFAIAIFSLAHEAFSSL